MNTREFLKETTKIKTIMRGYHVQEIRKPVICADGFRMSLQASHHHYCEPRENLTDGNYTEVEIGFPSEAEELLMEYAESHDDYTATVYGWVPVEVVDKVLEKHGGIVKIGDKEILR